MRWAGGGLLVSARLHPVPATSLDEYWPVVRDQIADATKRSGGRFSASVIYDALSSRAMQLWLAVNGSVQALAVTEILTYGTGLKVCSIIIVTGEDRNSWSPLVRGISDWASQNGCKRIEAWARPGWAKVTGWKETHRLIEAEI